MSEPFHESEVPVSQYGRWRRERFLANGQLHADMADRAALEAYGQSDDRRVTQAGQGGILGHQTPWERGAEVASRAAVVGSDYGGRPLQAMGGVYGHQVEGPAPARVDLRNIDQQGREPGISPLLAYMRGQQ